MLKRTISPNRLRKCSRKRQCEHYSDTFYAKEIARRNGDELEAAELEESLQSIREIAQLTPSEVMMLEMEVDEYFLDLAKHNFHDDTKEFPTIH